MLLVLCAIIVKPSGDFTIISSDETRIFMSHLNHPQPHMSPHIHINEIINENMVMLRIYPTDVPHQ